MSFELLGYPFNDNFNNSVISYDENGFISNKYIALNFKDENGDNASIFIHLIEKNDEYYLYHIQITEYADVGFGGVGHSDDIKIYYNQGIIDNIVVDGVVDGPLRDKYNDSFNITPNMYVHIINKNHNFTLVRAGC